MSSITGESIYQLFNHRIESGWLVNFPSADIARLHRLVDHKICQFSQSPPDFISIETTDAIEFIAYFMVGCRLGLPMFLYNPAWGTLERAQVARLIATANLAQHQHQIMIPTGGTSGVVKFAIHTWETLSASVYGFQKFYQVAEINSICVLPLYHVSGLMQLMRSLLTDGHLAITHFTYLTSLPGSIELDQYFISLVPTQLQKLLTSDADLLKQFHTILLGGAPPTLELLTQARLAQLPLALTYGMTETASQITSLKPAEFLAGNQSCGRVLPHAEICLRATATDGIGTISIKSTSLMLGYFPATNPVTSFEPDDLGKIDSQGYLTILGRDSDKIITGGENVFPVEVMAAIIKTGLVRDVWVVGVADIYWGQKVVAIYTPIDLKITTEMIAIAIADKISRYKIPKAWIQVTQIPRNALGKVSNQAVAALVTDYEKTHSGISE